ncbi:MAG: diadenylate cyclase CdaA [Clostridia bacterium]|nr:diadenylate cyclase CdaA [Clostridia bacterium]
MNLTEIFEKISNNGLNFTLLDLVDILLIAVAVYGLLKLTRKTRASQVLKGLGLFIVLAFACESIGLSAMSWVLNKFIEAGLIIIIIIFQPEIRRALEHMGRNKLFAMVSGTEIKDFSREIEEIERAVLNMSKHKVGALIVFENQTGLQDVIESGQLVDARITSELLENIFFHNAPLHDGAMIIKEDRIVAAGCFLPLSDNRNLSSELGTRHRAGLGISEVSDAHILIVSEENGVISLAHEGNLTRYLDIKSLHEVLEEIYHVKERSARRLIGGKVWKRNG